MSTQGDIHAQLYGFSKSLRPAFAGMTFTLRVYHYLMQRELAHNDSM